MKDFFKKPDELYRRDEHLKTVNQYIVNFLANWEKNGWKGYDYIMYADLVVTLPFSEQACCSLLQMFGLQDGDGNWSDNLITEGFIIRQEPNEYCGAFDMTIAPAKYLCSPHGNHFFQVFFQLASDFLPEKPSHAFF